MSYPVDCHRRVGAGAKRRGYDMLRAQAQTACAEERRLIDRYRDRVRDVPYDKRLDVGRTLPEQLPDNGRQF